MIKKLSNFNYTERAVIVASQPFSFARIMHKQEDGLIFFNGVNGSFCFPNLFKNLKPGTYFIFED